MVTSHMYERELNWAIANGLTGRRRLTSSTVMKRIVQLSLLALYRWLRATGVLSTPVGRGLFERSYDLYKTVLEAGPIGALQRFVEPGSTVIDVGANLGFFSRRFARWVVDGGRVVAIEPEPENCQRLQRALVAQGVNHVVDVVEAVAAESTGTRMLEINPDHPGDHRIGKHGLEVAAVTLDSLVAERGWPKISLIKIDVQGAEQAVLEGARRTLQRSRPALFVEIDDDALRRMGASAESLLSWLMEEGYAPHRLERSGIAPVMTVREVLDYLGKRRSYCDLLFLSVVTKPSVG